MTKRAGSKSLRTLCHKMSTHKPKFCVLNLGCKVNRAESDTMAATCMSVGGVQSCASEADVAIINTCTVTAEADAKTRKQIRKLLRESACPVVVTGCAAAMHADELAALDKRVIVEPARLRASQKAVEILCSARGGSGDDSELGEADECGDSDELAATNEPVATTKTATTPSLFTTYSPQAIKLRATHEFKTRMDIKIQDGCNNSCTYCIVHVARGPVSCLSVNEVIEQAKTAHDAGVGEIVLTGINLGSFNHNGARLPNLLYELMKTKIGRVRISSIEPPHINEQLAQVMSTYPERICAHLHVPLQSGCDRTLAAMHRLYDTQEFASRIAMVRAACPSLSLTTDVIVGFPQESNEDFEQSLEFCRKMEFSKMHVFRYSRREGTPAAEMTGQVPPEVSVSRARVMRELSDQMRRADARARVGSPERLLMMSPTIGMAQSYYDVIISTPQPEGSFVDVIIREVLEDGRLKADMVDMADMADIKN